jgi:hypothetical protein
VTHALLLKTLKVEQEPDFFRTLLATASNRRIVDVSQVIQKLEFLTLDTERTELHHLLQQSFQLRLIRWLHGRGHPWKLRGTLIPESLWDEQQEDYLVRSKLMVRAIADIELLPIDDLWTCKVNPIVNIIQLCY